jgi:hypothetical protein
MDITKFLSPPDAARAQRTIAKLLRHGDEPLTLTGGLATEIHRIREGFDAEIRPLNDIDLLADSFEAIPSTLSLDFLFRHVHPHDRPGKTLLQCVDAETAVRMDVFRSYGGVTARALSIKIADSNMRIISVEDLAARMARLCMDLVRGTPVPAKHARDYLRLLPLVDIGGLDAAWCEHRKPDHPASFADVSNLLTELIATRNELLIVPEYSHNTNETCTRCEATSAFPLADANRILCLLGYC